MTDTAASSPGRLGIWLADLADVLEMRQPLAVRVAVGVSLLGLILALLAPGLVPPEPLVGAVVGLVAGVLAAAAAVAADSGDAVVQGPRHVRALDATVAGESPVAPSQADLAPLARRLVDEAAGRSFRLAVTPVAHGSVTAQAWTEQLARAIAEQPRRVLLLDAVRRAEGAGISAVADGRARLEDAVSFDAELQLAVLRAGEDPTRTLEALPELWERLPGDVEVALAALPPMIEPGGLEVAGTADCVLVLVEQAESRRVDLLAALDAVETAGTPAQVVLLRREGGRSPWPGGEDRLLDGGARRRGGRSDAGGGAAERGGEPARPESSSVRVHRPPAPPGEPPREPASEAPARTDRTEKTDRTTERIDRTEGSDAGRGADSRDPSIDDDTDQALRARAAEQALTEEWDDHEPPR